MNNSSPWENEPWESQLASWKPRPASASLKARLFPATSATVAPPGPAMLWSGWRWLAPALVCSFVGLVVLSPKSHRAGRLSAAETNNFLVAAPAYVMAGFHSEQNGPTGEIFEWTFAPRSTSRSAFSPPAATNLLPH